MSNVAEPREPPMTPRWRRWLQFNLRTMLLATVVVSLGVWWWRQPKPVRVPMPGGWESRIHYQSAGEMRHLHGSYTLLDERGRVRMRGHYRASRPSGQWSTYHANGRVATRGSCHNGCRVGVWTSWYPDGRVRSRVAHNEIGIVCRGSLSRADPDVLDAILDESLRRLPSPAISLELGIADAFPASLRHGAATLFHPTGHRQAEGAFVEDRRDGLWMFWDAEGRRSAEGEYREGRREGVWTFWNEQGVSREVVYLSNRAHPPLDQTLPKLVAQLDGPGGGRAEAVEHLAQLGRPGIEILAARLGSAQDAALHLLILRKAAELPSRDWHWPAPQRARFQETLADDPLLQCAYWRVRVIHEPEQRKAHLERLFLAQRGLDFDQQQALWVRLAKHRGELLPSLGQILASTDPYQRRTAMGVLSAAASPYIEPPLPGTFFPAWNDALTELLQQYVNDPDPAIAATARQILEAIREDPWPQPDMFPQSIPVVG